MPSQSSFQRGQTTFYAPSGMLQPVIVTLDDLDERRAAYLADDGPADQYRIFAEPRWLFEQGAARGATLAQQARRELLTGTLTPERARLYARLTAVHEQYTRLTQAQEDRVGHRVNVGDKPGMTIFAEQHDEQWHYRVRLDSGRTVTVPREQLTDLDGKLPADTLPLVIVEVQVPPAETQAPPPAGLILPDVPPPSKPTEVRQFKGHPVIVLGLENDKEWSFGLAKARSILANLDALIEFVNSGSADEMQVVTAPDSAPDGPPKA